MIHGLDHQGGHAAAGVGANKHRRFGIQREAQLGQIVLHCRVLDGQLPKDRVCFRRFLGRLFRT
jgi:hypothetical protein